MNAFRLAAPILLAATVLAGCSTINSRIQKNTDVYESLAPEMWEKIQEGRVELGYTPEMVRIAFGPPDQMEPNADGGGRHETWTYRTFYHDYLNPARVGFRRYLRPDEQAGQPVGYFEPVTREAYQELGLAQPREETVIKITFQDARVVALEEATLPRREK